MGLMAQDLPRIPLRQSLQDLESRFNVSFTYADENIQGREVLSIPQGYSLEEALNSLQDQTGLIFKQLNDRFIAIMASDRDKAVTRCGTVKDAQTGKLLEGILVVSGENFTVTDINGFFSLTLTDGDEINFQSVNYHGRSITIRDEACPEVLLYPAVITLEEIVIRDLITLGMDLDVRGSFVIHTDRLGILPGLIEPDVLQSIQALPGIQSVTEKISDINIRGGTNDQNLVTWNGIKMFQTGHFFGLISAFNPYLTDEVTVIRNGTSAELGDGVSGSLLLQTDDEVSHTVSGAAGANMIYGDIWTKLPLGKDASIHLSGRRSFTDWFTSPTYEQYFDRVFSNTEIEEATRSASEAISSDESFYFYDVSGKLVWDPTASDRIRVSFLNINNKITYDEQAQVGNSVEVKTSSLEQRSQAGGISFRHQWNDSWTTELTGNISTYSLAAVNQDIINEQRLLQENEVLDVFGGVDVEWLFSANIRFKGGYQFRETGITNFDEINNPTFSRFVKEVIRTHAGFIEGAFNSPDNKTHVSVGLRMNYYDKLSEFLPEPRVTLSRKLAQFLTFELQGEMKSQVTTQVIDFQRDFLGVEKRRWLLSNGKDVPIIQSRQVSAGLSYHPATTLISAGVYIKDVEGITSSSQGFQNQFQRVRATGSYQVRGFDILLNKQFIQQVNGWLSYSYLKNDYSFPTLDPPEFPSNLDIRHTVAFGTNYQSDKLEASVGINWHSGAPFTEASGVSASGLEVLYNSPNGQRLDDYIRFDISARYNFSLTKGVKAQVGAAIWNITDQKNQLSTFYTIDASGQPSRTNETSLGLTPNILFRVMF